MSETLARTARILVVEDTVSLAEVYEAALAMLPAETSRAGSVAAALASLARERPDLVLLDLRLPDGHGLSLLPAIRRADRGLPVICITSHATVEIAVEAMRLGATDFLEKPIRPERLQATARHALERRMVRRADAQASPREAFCGMVGAAPAMLSAFRAIRDAAPTEALLHLTGEPGTGKELAARAVHRLSARRGRAFVAVNLAGLDPDEHLGAVFGPDGAAQDAADGTVFLDQVNAASPALQAALLGWLDTGAYPVPGTRRRRAASFRLVTSCDGSAGERLPLALFHRLAVVVVRLPPLRERGRDIVALAAYFLDRFAAEEGKRFAALSEGAEAALLARPWPGNVRELSNAVRSAVLLHDAATLEPDMLGAPSGSPPRKPRGRPGPSADPGLRIRPLAEIEREAIAEALRLCEGNAAHAAAHLGLAPEEMARRFAPSV